MPSTAGFIQGISGLVFGAYVVAHLTNHSLAVLGPDQYNATQEFLRAYYMSPVGEGILWASLLTHIIAGCYRSYTTPSPAAAAKSKTGAAASQPVAKKSLASTVHTYTGYILSILVFLHAYGVSAAPARMTFQLISFELKESDAMKANIMQVYFAVLSISAAVHFGLGVPRALRLIGWYAMVPLSRLLSTLLMIALSIGPQVGLAAMRGLLFPVPNYAGTEWVPAH
jgi:succinate dehydrogenase/fumarate reductase cytochrome b subunit